MELCTKRKSATTSWRSLWKWLVTCKRSSAHRQSASASRSASSRAAPWCTPYAAASHTCCSTLWQIPTIFQWCARVMRYRSPLAEVQNSRIHGGIGTSSSLSNRDRMRALVSAHTIYWSAPSAHGRRENRDRFSEFFIESPIHPSCFNKRWISKRTLFTWKSIKAFTKHSEKRGCHKKLILKCYFIRA